MATRSGPPDYWDARPPEDYPHLLYDQRARAVYWDKTTPACRAKGPSRAACLLNPGHSGAHYGNGYDNWGPKGAISWKARPRTRPGDQDD